MNETIREEDLQPIPHPLLDRSRDGWIETESRAPVIFLGSAQADLLQRGVQAGRPVVLVTDEHSGLTQPFLQALRERDGRWVVRAADGTLRDGLSGRRLSTIGDVLDRPHFTADDIAVRYLRPAQAEQLEVVLTSSVRHRANLDLRLGGAVELLALQLQGDPPAAWDALEPVAEEWDRDAMTEFARRRLPDDTRLLVRGRAARPLIATIHSARTAKGIEETTRAYAIVGAAGSPDADAAIAAVPGMLTALQQNSTVLISLVLARSRRPDQLEHPVLAPPPYPLAMLIGPVGVAALEVDVARATSEYGATVVGRPRIPGLLYSFGAPSPQAIERLTAVLTSFGEDKLREALGANRPLYWEGS
jgi:hypothetical protein